MQRHLLPTIFSFFFLSSCATVNVSGDDDDTTTDDTDPSGPVECDEDNAEELCGDPELCVDGFCCDSPCMGGCDACNLPDLEGTCSPMEAGTVCREAAGLCDSEELCDGEDGECPADVILGQEDVCRPAVGECDEAEYCDGLSVDGCPEDGFAQEGAACGLDEESECDGADSCDGAGVCLTNHEPDTVACGDSSDSECDNPDMCDGAGSCAANYEADTVACGDATSTDCNAPDTCDGAGSCGANYVSVGTACGDTSESTCDHADTCDGFGVCAVNLEASTTVCRAAVSDCDFDEYCDGAGACPADVTKSPGDACGDGLDSECDNPDTCDALLVCQPNYEPTTTACSSATACEVALNCDGAGDCGGGGYLPEGTLCGSTLDTECDDPDTCDATGTCLPNYASSSTACGSPADSECDDPDTCDGSGTCLTNYEPALTACGSPANTDCTDPDTCDGSGTCLENNELAATSCGDPTNTTCNGADTCDGSGTCNQNLAGVSTVCRAAAGDCDLAETCDGLGGCPTDTFKSPGTSCGSGPTVCSGQDTCDGTGGCLPNNYPTTTTCGTTVTEYQCSAAGCLATPQSRVVGQHCDTGSCVNDTGVTWINDPGGACLSDEVCMSSTASAWCDLCDTIPSDYCDGDGDAWHYPLTGTCSGGSCSYVATEEDCSGSCSVSGTEAVCTSCNDALMAVTGAPYWSWETGNEGWDMGGDWSRYSAYSHTGSYSMDFYLWDYYDYEDDRTMWTSSYDFTDCSGCTINAKFWVYGSTESCCDGLYLQCSGNGGSTWTNVGTEIMGYYSWTEFTRTLPASCLTGTTRLAFWFESDLSITDYGYVVDDLRLTTTATAPNGWLDFATTTTAHGWACDGDDWTDAIEVKLYFYKNGIGTPEVRTTLASETRTDLITAGVCGSTPDHGYTFVYDAALLTWLGAGTHTVRAYGVDGPDPCGAGEYELSGSPINFTL